MFLSSADYPSGQITSFNIGAAKDSKNGDIHAIYRELVLLEGIGFGQLFIQNDTGHLWYIDPEKTIARLITAEQRELFHEWNRQPLLPSAEQFEVLSNIGGRPSSRYSMYPNAVSFPARVVTKSGEQIDLCVFQFSKTPPFQSHFKNLLLLSDIAEIQPSELALSHQLRLASTQVDEIRMSFYPFMVETASGRSVTYNGVTDFASTGEIKGNEVLSQVEFTYEKFEKIEDVSFDDMTFVIGKWDDRMNGLFVQYNRQLQEMIAREDTPAETEQKWWQRLFKSR